MDSNPEAQVASSGGDRLSGKQTAVQQRTRERLLRGALEAVASRGLAKFAMSDVSEFAGMSRGTAYRYFSNTEELLSELGRREAERFEQQVWDALEKTPATSTERIRVVLDAIEKLARDHPLIQRLPETDPGFVLTSIRERFPDIRETFERLLVPQLEGSALMQRAGVNAEQLANWMARMMISLFLFPEPNPRELGESMHSVYEILIGGALDSSPEPTEGQPRGGDERSRPEKGEEMRRSS